MRYFILLVGLCFVIGCGPGGAVVTGKVTLDDGSAAPRGAVMLRSDAGSFHGAIESDGTYTIENVADGEYAVAVTGVMDAEPSDDETGGMGAYDDETGEYAEVEAVEPKSLIKDIYSNPTTSGLTVTVPGGSYDLKLDRADGSGGVDGSEAPTEDGSS